MINKLFSVLTFVLLSSCINKNDIKNAITFDYRNDHFKEKFWSIQEVEILAIDDCCSADFKSKLDLKLKEFKVEDLQLESKLDSIYNFENLSDEEIAQKIIDDLAIETSYINITGKSRPTSELEKLKKIVKENEIESIRSHLNLNKEKENFINDYNKINNKNNKYKIVKVIRKQVYNDYKSTEQPIKIDTVEYLYQPKNLVIKL